MVSFEDQQPTQTNRPCTAMQYDIKYLYNQTMTLYDQGTGECYRMQISEYEVSEINYWENATQCNFLSMQLHQK